MSTRMQFIAAVKERLRPVAVLVNVAQPVCSSVNSAEIKQKKERNTAQVRKYYSSDFTKLSTKSRLMAFGKTFDKT